MNEKVFEKNFQHNNGVNTAWHGQTSAEKRFVPSLGDIIKPPDG